MKLVFLGSGSAFTLGQNYQSNMLLEHDSGKKLLIDCGSDARWSLREQGLSYQDIHDVYVSHLHADHVGGLEWLAFTTKFDPSCTKPTLHICDDLVYGLWHKVLAGGLSSLQTEAARLSTYFNVQPIADNGCFSWEGLEIQLVKTTHVISDFTILPSYGLLFAANGLKVFITTDIQFLPVQFQDFYQSADIIFHDCETAPVKSKVHSHYEELVTLPTEIKNKLWLYHYNPGSLPDALKDGFRGFVKKGQCFDFNDKSTL